MSDPSPDSPSPDPPSARPAVLNPFPDHRDLYVLVAGIILGILLSPAVLGQVAPETYERWFVGTGEAGQALQELEQEIQGEIAALEASGATGVRADERRAQYEPQLAALRLEVRENELAHRQWLAGRMSALLLAVIGVAVVEALVSPRPEAGQTVVRPALSRLKMIRYALLALWLALAIAHPTLLRELAWGFLVLLIAVVLLAAFVPLGRRVPKTAS